MFRIKYNMIGYINDAWRNFDDHCHYENKNADYCEFWKQELAKFNGRSVFTADGTRFFEFDTEADYTFFLLRWS